MSSKKQQIESIRSKQDLINFYFDRLKLITLNRFKWLGIDEVCGFGAEYFIEQILFRSNKVCFFKDKNIGYVLTDFNFNGNLNIYYMPTYIQPLSGTTGYYFPRLSLDDCCIMFNTNNFQPLYFYCLFYAKKLAELQLTADINMANMRMPILIEGNKQSLLAMQNIWQKIESGQPAVYANRDFDINSKLNVLKTDAPYLIDKLEVEKNILINEYLTLIGVNNANLDKKERQITSEIESNNEQIRFYLNSYLEPRQKFAKMINDKYFNGDEKIKIEINKGDFDERLYNFN